MTTNNTIDERQLVRLLLQDRQRVPAEQVIRNAERQVAEIASQNRHLTETLEDFDDEAVYRCTNYEEPHFEKLVTRKTAQSYICPGKDEWTKGRRFKREVLETNEFAGKWWEWFELGKFVRPRVQELLTKTRESLLDAESDLAQRRERMARGEYPHPASEIEYVERLIQVLAMERLQKSTMKSAKTPWEREGF